MPAEMILVSLVCYWRLMLALETRACEKVEEDYDPETSAFLDPTLYGIHFEGNAKVENDDGGNELSQSY